MWINMPPNLKPSCWIRSGIAGWRSSSWWAWVASSRHFWSLEDLFLYWGLSFSCSSRARRRSLCLSATENSKHDIRKPQTLWNYLTKWLHPMHLLTKWFSFILGEGHNQVIPRHFHSFPFLFQKYPKMKTQIQIHKHPRRWCQFKPRAARRQFWALGRNPVSAPPGTLLSLTASLKIRLKKSPEDDITSLSVLGNALGSIWFLDDFPTSFSMSSLSGMFSISGSSTAASKESPSRSCILAASASVCNAWMNLTHSLESSAGFISSGFSSSGRSSSPPKVIGSLHELL